MKNLMSREWKHLKSELVENINKTMESENVDREVLEMMLDILENSKFKVKEKEL
jgi:hypothetical protein